MSDTTGIVILIVLTAVMYLLFRTVGKRIADSIVSAPSGTRRTYAHNAAIIGLLLGLLVGSATDSLMLALLVFFASSLIGYIILRVIENAIDQGAHKAEQAITDAIDRRKTSSGQTSSNPKAVAGNQSSLARVAAEKEREEKRKEEQRILKEGGWRCAFCQRVYPAYVSSCSCGRSRSETESFLMGQGAAMKSVEAGDVVKVTMDVSNIAHQSQAPVEEQIVEKPNFENLRPMERAIAEREWENKKKEEQRLLQEGGWRCAFCNTVNGSVFGTCSCGRKRYESEELMRNKAQAQKESEESNN